MSILTRPVIFERETPQQAETIKRFQLERFFSFEQVARLQPKWDELVRRVDGDIFGTYDWCAAWWRHFGEGRQLSIFVATYGDQIVGVLPLYEENISWGPLLSLHVMRPVGSEHAGSRSFWCVEPSWTEEFAAALETAVRDLNIDILYVGDMPGYFEESRELAGAFAEAFGPDRTYFVRDHYPHSVFDLPATFESYLSGLHKKERSNINIAYRRLKEHPEVTVEEVDGGNVDAHFDSFVELHERQWASKGRLGLFRDLPGSKEFHRDVARQLARRGRLMFLRFGTKDAIGGYHYAFRFGERLHWVQGARSVDPRWEHFSPGRLMHCELVRRGIDVHVRQIDGLSGHYDFKQRLGARFVGLQSLAVVSPQFAARQRIHAFRAITALVEKAYFTAWFWRAAPWMRTHVPHIAHNLHVNHGLAEEYVNSRFIVPALSGGPLSRDSAVRPISGASEDRAAVAGMQISLA